MNNIIVIGDILLDHNIFTIIQNPKLKDYNIEYNLDYEEYKLGGCGNISNNLHCLGTDNIFLFSAIGDDDNGKKIQNMVNSLNIHNYIQVIPSYNTTIKRRYYHNNIAIFQHANRINIEKLTSINFCNEIEKVILHNKINCIILCESEKASNGILYVEHCQQLIALANKYNIPTIVDPKEDIYKYKGCTIIKPNKDEAYSLLNLNLNLIDVHKNILNQIQCQYSIITLSEEGISIYDGNNEIRDMYQGVLQVIDTVGGGDIVTSIVSFFYNKIQIKDIIHIAVNMASKSVEKPGVIAIYKKDIINFLFPEKIIKLEYLPLFRVLFDNVNIGATTGCFDLLHQGHITSLKWCKEICDILVVCLNSDESVKALKGDSRPIQNISIRTKSLFNMNYVDYIIIFNESSSLETIKSLRPNIFMKGGDYANTFLQESEFSNETRIGPYLEGISTTQKIIKIPKIFEFYNEWHYGDAIFNLRFFYNIRNELKSNFIKINYFYSPKYIKNIKELEKYIDNSTLTIYPLYHPVMNNPINLWMGIQSKYYSNHYKFIEYFNDYYLGISKILGITLDPIYVNFFQPEYYLKTIYDNIDSKFKALDFLILNSEPQSDQFKKYNKQEFDNLCIELNKMSYKIATTTLVNEEIPCTFTDGLTIQDIGAISTHAKYIIAILSGPVTSCFNLLTINNVDTIYLFCDKHFTFNHSKIKTLDTLDTLDKLSFLLVK
jgi:D-beta-D-heptose 7-phosphate kinase/D-beta-D-heptose 1-phosphate adenosyltransferase